MNDWRVSLVEVEQSTATFSRIERFNERGMFGIFSRRSSRAGL